ncbi:MAG: hypothetical protein V3W20_10980 [Candidatus Neomarinimicrobiota bacterium]
MNKARKKHIEIVSAPVGKNFTLPKGQYTCRIPASGTPELRSSDGTTIISFSQIAYRTSYGRNNGKNDKTLNQIMLSKCNLDYLANPGSIYRELIKFHSIFAIDTNTISINKNERISVCCFLHGLIKTKEDNSFECIAHGQVQTHIFKGQDPPGSEEKQAIMWLINNLKNAPGYSDILKIAIITDHDLGSHTDYNQQQKPFFNDNYLPNNFQLLYASSDTGKENLLNRLIAICDKEARKTLKKIKREFQQSEPN